MKTPEMATDDPMMDCAGQRQRLTDARRKPSPARGARRAALPIVAG